MVKVLGGELETWTIYKSPSDYPGLFVLRRFRIKPAGVVVADVRPWGIAKTLEDVRKSLPEGLYNVGRRKDDEPQIVETWV